MVRRTAPTPTDDAPDDAPETEPPDDARRLANGGPDLAALPIVGITRRRMATIIGALLACWIVILFARQVGDASAATGRAEAMVASNEARRAEISGLEDELGAIQKQAFVLQQARGHGLGGSHEVAFSLAPGAPALAADAPGSAASRVGAPSSVSPLERWLTLLFGPGD
jgi:hypothetical protein